MDFGIVIIFNECSYIFPKNIEDFYNQIKRIRGKNGRKKIMVTRRR